MQSTTHRISQIIKTIALRPHRYAVAFILFCGFSTIVTADDIPVAPIETISFGGHDDYLLKNKKMSVLIDPIFGGLVKMTYRESENLLSTNNPAQLPGEGVLIETDAPQSDKSWKGRAWKSTDGSQHALLTRHLGPPLDLKCTRHYRLDAERAILSIEDKMERTGYSQSPVAIVSYLNLAGSYPGYHPETNTNQTNGVGMVQIAEEEAYRHEQNRPWLAAQQKDFFILQEFHAGALTANPSQPGHSSLEHDKSQRMHLHQQSPSAALQPGDRIEQTTVLYLTRIATNLAPREIKAEIDKLLSSKP